MDSAASAIFGAPPAGTAGTVMVALNEPAAVVVVLARISVTLAAVTTPIVTVKTEVGLAEFPTAEQPEKFCPVTVIFVPGAAVRRLTANTGTLHEGDGFGGAVAADADNGAISANAPAAIDTAMEHATLRDILITPPGRED